MADFKPKRPGKRNSKLTMRLVEVVIVLLIIYFIASWVVGATSVTLISSPTNVTFTNTTTLFIDNTTNFNGTAGRYANMQLKLFSTGSKSAVVQITPIPSTIALNPSRG